MKYSKIIVMLIILANILFASSVLFIFFKVGNEPNTLIIAWFGFTTGELAIMGSIKKKEKSKIDDLIGRV